MPKTRYRIADVAAAAGVSPATVSHALSGRRPVSAATRAKVTKAVEELGYTANALARSLRTRSTQTIALVIPDITNPFYPVVARGVQDAMSEAGYQVVVCSTDADPARELTFVRDMAARSVDGMILDLFRTSSADLVQAVGDAVPLVTLGEFAEQGTGDRVVGDDRVSVAEATRHLLRTGRRRIAFVGGEADAGPGGMRRAGYEDALLGGGMIPDPDLILTGDYSRDGAAAAMRGLLERGQAPDAVVAVNDLAAIGVLGALRTAGLSVPDDVAVIGYDDIDAASLVTPGLTTVDNRAYDKGLTCGRLLLQRMTGELTGPLREIVVPGRFVQRESA